MNRLGGIILVLAGALGTWELRRRWNTLVTRMSEAESGLRHVRRLALERDRLALMGTLAAGIVHDVRSPLVNAVVLVQLAKKKGPSWMTPENIEIIDAQLSRVLKLSDRLLTFVNPAGAFSKAGHLVEELFQSVAGMMALDFSARKVRIHTEIEPADLMIHTNRSALEHALLNLTTNASHAMKGEGEIRLIAKTKDDQIILEIADTGPGIPEDLPFQLFKGFSSSGEGHGIGLAITASIVEGLGGTISAENATAGGAVFRIMLPEERKDLGIET